MPFNRTYDLDREDFVIDRTLTGPPVPTPSKGKVQSQDGTIVGASADIRVAPAKPIPVKMPGPRQVVMNPDGTMNFRWWRFFEELHRRTGALEDNVNWSETQLGSGTAGSITLTGQSPSAEITHSKAPLVVGLSLTGKAPTITVA